MRNKTSVKSWKGALTDFYLLTADGRSSIHVYRSMFTEKRVWPWKRGHCHNLVEIRSFNSSARAQTSVIFFITLKLMSDRWTMDYPHSHANDTPLYTSYTASTLHRHAYNTPLYISYTASTLHRHANNTSLYTSYTASTLHRHANNTPLYTSIINY